MQNQSAQDHTATYFDGASNRKRRIALRMASALELIEDGVRVGRWPYEAIRRVDGPQGRLRLRSVDALPLARVELEDAALARALTLRCPALDADRGGAGRTGRIVFWSIAAACSIVAVTLFGIPIVADRLAPLVPAAVEKRIGEAVDGQVRVIFAGKVCNNAEGKSALAALVDKLQRAGDIQTPLDAQVLSAGLPNALALPGGKIYLLEGLLRKARNPDEIAGIIAHELGHIRNRDGLRKVIQTGGTSFLVGLLFGDVVGGGAVVFAARSLLDASYSRQAETSADAFVVAVMHKLGRSPKPMGELLMRITGAQANKSLTLLASHPMTEDRLGIMQKEDRSNTGPDLLSEREWQALTNICGEAQPHSREDGFG